MEKTGVVNEAPELRVPIWIDEEGADRTPLRLADLGSGFKILYCFQHWCPGCHATGFPTLKLLVPALSGKNFSFAVIQTVFEGHDSNTVDRLRETQLRYGLSVPFGHDSVRDHNRRPTVMEDYKTGGTPWFIVVNPQNQIVFSDFRLDAEQFVTQLDIENYCNRLANSVASAA